MPSLSCTQSLNRYAYVSNNPVNATDPLGLNDCPQGKTCGFPVTAPIAGLLAFSLNWDPSGDFGPGFLNAFHFNFSVVGGLGNTSGGGETLGIPNWMPFPTGSLSDFLPEIDQQCDFGPCGGGGFGFTDGPSSPVLFSSPFGCAYSAMDEAHLAREDYEKTRDQRIALSAARGAVQGAVFAAKTERVALLIPFVGPYVATETTPEAIALGGSVGAVRGTLNGIVLDKAKALFVQARYFVGASLQCLASRQAHE